MIAATTQRSRQAALAAMSDDEGLDVLVVGGGVTGAGVALDAATRGLRTGIVEMQDWASGTSSRSSKLIHGGMRYLYNLDFALVQEALRERGLLLSTIAPHLVRPQPFLWPLKIPVVERTYSALGVGLYDAMSAVGNLTLPGDKEGAGVPPQKHYGRKGALELFPDLRSDQLTGAIRFYDARVDDARLVLGLVRTAVSYGALAATRAQVTEITKDAVGRVVGAVVTDLETGRARQVRAKHVISCTGVWTEETESLASSTGSLEVLASKGVHLVIPKDRIKGSTGLFLRTEKSVLFVIPWQHYWVIGTTDTPWEGPLRHPITTRADIDYVLEQANKVLTSQLTTDDILGTWAGLRPLLQPSGGAESSAKVSREHTVAEVAPGMVSIAGGKLTTYRVMAEDAVDFALGSTAARRWPSITDRIPLVGAVGLEAAGRYLARVAPGYGWDADRIEHLLSRYGSEVGTLIDLIEEDPRLAEPLPSAPAYLGVEVAFAVQYEGSLHLEDVLLHRLRIDHEARDRGLSAVDDVLAIAVPLLGWDEDRQQAEVDAYRARLAGIRAGEAEWSDAEAIAERSRAEDLIPIRPLRRAHRI